MRRSAAWMSTNPGRDWIEDREHPFVDVEAKSLLFVDRLGLDLKSGYGIEDLLDTLAEFKTIG